MPELVTLVDDFQDNSIDTSLWVTAGTVAETSGRARLTPGTTYAIWQAVSAYDMNESQITIEVPVVTAAGTTGTLQCGMVVEEDSSYQISIRKLGTNLVVTQNIHGVSSDLAFAPYNATNHRFWRIRKASNTVFWETSPNGSGSFFIQYSANVSTLFPMGAVTPFFFAGYSGFESSPGTFQIEAVNVPPTITASGVSTSSGSAVLRIFHTMSANGSSISAGSATLLLRRYITASATSISDGSAALTISSPGPLSITASGTSTSSATASFIILTPGQMTANAASFSSGSATLHINYMLSAVGQSFATGTATLTIIPDTTEPVVTQYFYFEPPIVYDRPTTIYPPRPPYINAYARWQKGQARGRSVLRTGSSIQVLDTPTVDQTISADAYYAGGHVYIISNFEADLLSAAGLVVRPIPVIFTLYPGEDVFPTINLSPGYQELLP